MSSATSLLFPSCSVWGRGAQQTGVGMKVDSLIHPWLGFGQVHGTGGQGDRRLSVLAREWLVLRALGSGSVGKEMQTGGVGGQRHWRGMLENGHSGGK